MAIDYIFGALLLIISLLVNGLALAAFWLTPGLRTTANRFVINLLIVNLVGCLALAPSLFLYMGDETIFDQQSQQQHSTVDQLHHTEFSMKTTTIEKIITTTTTIQQNINNFNNNNVTNNKLTDNFLIKCDNKTNHHDCQFLTTSSLSSSSSAEENANLGLLQHQENKIIIAEIDNEEEEEDGVEEIDENINNSNNHKLFMRTSRCWGLDLTTALGALSVLIVVGDTWCAITDPLRYHTRVSEFKAWTMIIGTWCVSILFGIASAFRSKYYIKTSINTSTFVQRDEFNFSSSMNSSSIETAQLVNSNSIIDDIPINIYNIIFSSSYFLVIILIPVCLISIMYWKIFSEAKQNGVRMRKNGSSPLLQSALNLAVASAAYYSAPPSSNNNNHQQQHLHHQIHHHHHHQQQTHNGLTMKIDHEGGTNECEKPLLPPSGRYLDIPKVHLKEKHHNVLMKITSSNNENHKIRRNHSTKHLCHLESSPTSPLEHHLKSSMRHVQSTPNLQKSYDNVSANHVHELPIIPPRALRYMTSLRHRLSNASSIFKYREESRAARISILVVIMFLCSYFPYGLLVLLQSFIPFTKTQSYLSTFFVITTNLSSPIIFAYRNKRLRRGVCRLFGIDSKTNDRLQKRRMNAQQKGVSITKVSIFPEKPSQKLGNGDSSRLSSSNSSGAGDSQQFSLIKFLFNSSRQWVCMGGEKKPCTDTYQPSNV